MIGDQRLWDPLAHVRVIAHFVSRVKGERERERLVCSASNLPNPSGVQFVIGGRLIDCSHVSGTEGPRRAMGGLPFIMWDDGWRRECATLSWSTLGIPFCRLLGWERGLLEMASGIACIGGCLEWMSVAIVPSTPRSIMVIL